MVGSNFIVSKALTVSCCIAPEGAAVPLAGLVGVATVQAAKSGSRMPRDTRDARFTRLPFRQRAGRARGSGPPKQLTLKRSPSCAAGGSGKRGMLRRESPHFSGADVLSDPGACGAQRFAKRAGP